MSAVVELAEMLIEARTSGLPIVSVRDELVPGTAEQAQAVDDAVARLSGWPVLGWKIGCTSTYAQELLGSEGPFAGRVYQVVNSATVLEASKIPAEPLLEGEFAFTLSDGISTGSNPPNRSQLVDAIANVRPAIEVVGGRYATFVGLDLRLIIADAGANALVALGPPVDHIDLTSLKEAGAAMTVDGQRTGAGTGADVLGDPLNALEWLVDHLLKRDLSLEAGQVISTGTATQVSHLRPGSAAMATFDRVGSVSLSRR